MKEEKIYLGGAECRGSKKAVEGGYLDVEGERFYRIKNYDLMPPFFMSIVSDSDHWMFISSNGALTAGRINPDNALFPYYTDDRIHDSQDVTGSKTVVFVVKDGKRYLWEPFSPHCNGLYAVERSIYKNCYGNKLLFEEINVDLGVTFRYAWLNSETFGFVRRSAVKNNSDSELRIALLDGIQNILPYGIDRRFQLEYSTLADGYKRNELLPDTGLGIFRLSSIPTDKAEPSEALKATTVWSIGAEGAKKLLSAKQLAAFRQGLPVEQEIDVKGMRGAYFVNLDFFLPAGAEKEWFIVADINKDSAAVADLQSFLKKAQDLRAIVLEDVQRGCDNLVKIVAAADGLQATGDELSAKRHFSNVLFNVMRGGIFDDGYWVSKNDFTAFVKKVNKAAVLQHAAFLANLPERLRYSELRAKVAEQNDPILRKLCSEYMPLTFGRRHGDPSRPWNIFSINIKDEQGNKILDYQGNWRDIFQNWEALALSFPEFIESKITKFVNASTPDGYNPYRVTRDGFEWEELDPNDAWSYIGYWGDHQIIYLLKLLELSARYHPGRLEGLLAEKIFAYANVPYRIKPYEELLRDPHNTIVFDHELDGEIKRRVQQIGTDGKFVFDKSGKLYQVNLTEKLLVPLLAKLSNFIPEAGIWMNTQRPEWNDANNALVGYGVSMVTLYYMRRYLAFCRKLFGGVGKQSFPLSAEVFELLQSIRKVLEKHLSLLSGRISDRDRKTVLDGLGTAGSLYRRAVYGGFSEKEAEVSAQALVEFFDLALKHVDHSIRANKRDDRLYHAYNLIKIKKDEIAVRTLYEMLEGQTAVLSSGCLSPAEAADLLDALRRSPLYRADQNSYILYPNRQLPRFIEKNTLPADFVESSPLLQTMLRDGFTAIVKRDGEGRVHFNGAFRNARLLRQALDALQDTPYAAAAEREKQSLLDLYEAMFDHQSFTGRSGTFYKYEGLGSIYWHMVSKLQLAAAELFQQAVESGEDQSLLRRLAAHYYDIREGVGVHKPPELYGAFPTDPYSHTPEFAGAQQPGMTGQVKEDILSRFMELGVTVEDGCVNFSGALLKASEFISRPATFEYYDVFGERCRIELEPGSLAFTLCGVPVVYHNSKESRLELRLDGQKEVLRSDSLRLDQAVGRAIFERRGEVRRIDVFLTPSL